MLLSNVGMEELLESRPHLSAELGKIADKRSRVNQEGLGDAHDSISVYGFQKVTVKSVACYMLYTNIIYVYIYIHRERERERERERC